jgi:hypothetical protein
MGHYVDEGFKSFQVGSADIPAGTAVKFGTSGNAGKLVVATAATDKIIGVIHSIGRAGSVIDVRLRSAAGTANMTVNASTAIAANDYVTCNGSGLAVATVTSNDQIIGLALEAAAVNTTVEIMLSTGKV